MDLREMEFDIAREWERIHGRNTEDQLDEAFFQIAETVIELEMEPEEENLDNGYRSPQPTTRDLLSEIAPFHEGPLGRCRRCGARVFLPCLACRCESAASETRSTTTEIESVRALHNTSFQLRPEHHNRYEAVRREREVLQGRPS